MRKAVAAFLVLLLSSCWQTYHLRIYEGAALSRSQVALLKTGVGVIIWSIDSTKLVDEAISNSAFELELLPGAHTLEVYVNWAGGGSTLHSSPKSVQFKCKAGHVYEVKIFLPGTPREYGTTVKTYDWYPAIIDSEANEIVSQQ
jgi:hypothetical protein